MNLLYALLKCCFRMDKEKRLRLEKRQQHQQQGFVDDEGEDQRNEAPIIRNNLLLLQPGKVVAVSSFRSSERVQLSAKAYRDSKLEDRAK